MSEDAYKIGDLVEVVEYYHDMIPKGTYTGVILEIRSYNDHVLVYDILNSKTGQVHSAEKFALSKITEAGGQE